MSLSFKYLILLLAKINHRQYLNKWAWLFFSKILLKKNWQKANPCFKDLVNFRLKSFATSSSAFLHCKWSHRIFIYGMLELERKATPLRRASLTNIRSNSCITLGLYCHLLDCGKQSKQNSTLISNHCNMAGDC